MSLFIAERMYHFVLHRSSGHFLLLSCLSSIDCGLKWVLKWYVRSGHWTMEPLNRLDHLMRDQIKLTPLFDSIFFTLCSNPFCVLIVAMGRTHCVHMKFIFVSAVGRYFSSSLCCCNDEMEGKNWRFDLFKNVWCHAIKPFNMHAHSFRGDRHHEAIVQATSIDRSMCQLPPTIS